MILVKVNGLSAEAVDMYTEASLFICALCFICSSKEM